MDAEVTSGRAGSSRLADLFEEHAPAAGRLAFLLTGDPHLAEEIAQEAFVRVAGRFGGLRRPDAFEAYLRKTIVNLSRGHWRRLRVERAYLQREGPRAAREVEPPDVAGRDELQRALARLSARQRAAIVLRYYEDLSEAQTADVLGCSVGTVKSLVSRGMRALRVDLKEGDL